MSTTSQPVFRAFRRGWNWWTRELSSLASAAMRGPARSAPPGLVVWVEPGGWHLIDERAAQRGRKKPLEIAGDEVFDTLVAAGRARKPIPVRLRLPHAACFVRHVELPAAARADVHRFLALDLERATPFRHKDVLSAHLIDEARAHNATLAVTQYVVRRDMTEKHVAEIEATGVTVSGIDCWDENRTQALPLEFMKRDPALNLPSPLLRLNKIMAAAALALTLSAGYISYSRHEEALSDLTQKTAEARQRSRAAQQAMAQSDEAVKDSNALQKLKSDRRPAVEIMDGLTRLLPDSVWLSDFRLDEDQIEITGEADAAAPLVSLVENSPLFSDTAFTAPVTRVAGGKQRFGLRARLETAGSTQPVAAPEGAP